MAGTGEQRIGSRTSLQARITLLLLLLLATVIAGLLAATWISTARNVRSQVGSELEVGARVFEELMSTRAQQLVESVAVLANDFAFREAVATDDAPTIRSALDNHGGRISADRVFLLDLDGRVMIGPSEAAEEAASPLPGLLDAARDQGGAAGLVLLDGAAYHTVLAPVRTPLPSAWVGMAFRLDAALARSFSELMQLDVVFLDAGGRALSSSSDSLQALQLSDQIGQRFDFRQSGERYLGLVHRPDSPDAPPRVLLAASLDDAFAPYQSLGMQLLGIVVVALGLAVLAAWWMASSVVGPVKQLARVANRIAGGHYEESVPRGRSDEIGDLAHAFSRMQSGIRKREDRIRFQARHDRLTGLPNRGRARELLADRIGAGPDGEFAVLMIDIKEFRQINDSLGHEIGDEVLQVVAGRLCRLAGEQATVSRLGGDEFMIVADALDVEGARALAARIAAALGETQLPSSDVRMRIECGLGIAVFPEHGRDAETLMRRADIALAEARRERLIAASYRAGRDEQHLHQLQLARELPDAIRRGQMRVLLQPKISLAGGEVIGAEALVRWQHPEYGLLTPDRFIELAERSGQIHQITRWVLIQSIDRLVEWEAAGCSRGIAVNLSALDLSEPDFVPWLKDRLAGSGIPPGRLLLEVTETAVMRDVDQARAVLVELRELGIRVAIDDFGTGHSSLAQLQSLPVDQLKIDKSFVLGLTGGDDAYSTIVESIIELGHRMKLEVLAEGVENETIRGWLTQAGCELAQGFCIAHPMPENDFTDWAVRYTGEHC